MLTLFNINSGEIKIFGKELTSNREEILSKIGSVIETPIFYENSTARQILELHARYMNYPLKKSDISNVMNKVGLTQNSKKVKSFSLGMRQRLGIARALLTKPKLLILDEPINGLDPVGVQEIRNILLTLSKKHGVTILVSSHILSEISQIVDTIGVIKNGRLVEKVTMERLRRDNIRLEDYFMSHFQKKSCETIQF